MAHYRITTTLSPDECYRALVGAGGDWHIVRRDILPYETRVLTVVSGRRFQLYRYTGYFNFFGYRFYGAIVNSSGSTEIQGAVRLSLTAILALAGFPAILIAILAPAIWSLRFDFDALCWFGLIAVMMFFLQGVFARRYATPYLEFLQGRFDNSIILK
jgi:hypothetical protein